jgi:hypothetical protein
MGSKSSSLMWAFFTSIRGAFTFLKPFYSTCMSKDYDPLSTESIPDGGKEQKNKRAKELEDLRHVLSDPRGRRVINRLLEKTGVYRNPFTGNSETYFRCGEMNIGQFIVAEVQAVSPDSYTNLLKEFNENGN